MVEMGSNVGKSFNLQEFTRAAAPSMELDGKEGGLSKEAVAPPAPVAEEASLGAEEASGEVESPNSSGKGRALLKTNAHFGERATSDHDHDLVGRTKV